MKTQLQSVPEAHTVLRTVFSLLRNFDCEKLLRDSGLFSPAHQKKEKYRNSYDALLQKYHENNQKILKWYPDGHTPSAERLEKYIEELYDKRAKKNAEYNVADQKLKELSQASVEIENYLRQEQSRDQQKRRRIDLE